MVAPIPFIQFQAPTISRKPPGFLERIAQTAVTGAFDIGASYLSSKLRNQMELDLYREKAEIDRQNAIARGEIVEVTPELQERAARQNVELPTVEIGETIYTGGEYATVIEAREYQREAAPGYEEAGLTSPGGEPITREGAEVIRSAPAAVQPHMVGAPPSEVSVTQEMLSAAGVSEDIVDLANGEVTFGDTQAAQSLAAWSAQNTLAQNQYALAREELSYVENQAALQTLQTKRLRNQETGEIIPLTPADARAINMNATNIPDGFEIVDTPVPYNIDDIIDGVTRAEFAGQLRDRYVHIVKKAQLNVMPDGYKLDDSEITGRITNNHPDGRSWVGAILLTEMYPKPQHLLYAAQQGMLPIPLGHPYMRRMLTYAQLIYEERGDSFAGNLAETVMTPGAIGPEELVIPGIPTIEPTGEGEGGEPVGVGAPATPTVAERRPQVGFFTPGPAGQVHRALTIADWFGVRPKTEDQRTAEGFLGGGAGPRFEETSEPFYVEVRQSLADHYYLNPGDTLQFVTRFGAARGNPEVTKQILHEMVDASMDEGTARSAMHEEIDRKTDAELLVYASQLWFAHQEAVEIAMQRRQSEAQ